MHTRGKRLLGALAAVFTLCSGLLTAATATAGPATPAAAFNVLAFYNGTWDAAHIDFVKEANERFPSIAAENGFTYTATKDWNRLNDLSPSQYQVVMFLDDAPDSAQQRGGFQRYLDGGGAYFGFHVSAFTTSPQSWPWFYNTLLGTGAFRNNTWKPTAAKLRVDNRDHGATRGLPAVFTSAVSEWYSWTNNLRNNPNISVLASVDQSSFPVGTDPSQSWYSGDYPILWAHKQYRMLYANFGHNAMNYDTNTRLSSTFDSADQNRFLVNGLKWLGRAIN